MSTNGEKEAVAQVGLKREIGLPSAISMILAVMIGSGIFITPSTALQETGSIGFCLVVWVVSGVLSLLGALAFAELSAVVPRSGAEYAYFVEAFSPLHRYLGQLPAFICSWVFVFILRPAEVAVITLTFAEYFVQPFRGYIGEIDEETYGYVKKMIAILALGLMVYINVISVKLYVKVQNICTACKVAACFLVIGGGIFWLAMGHTELLSEPFKGTNTAPGNIALAFYSGLWAYDGWTASAIVAEEVKRPEINILRSILVAVPVITVLYVSMNVMYMSALTVPEMINAQAVAIAWGDVVLPGWLTYAIPFGVAVSTFGCGLSIQFGVARLCYVAGQEGHVPRFFSWVHYEHMTPAAAVVLQGLLTLVCMVSGSIAELIELASFLIWAFYGLAMVALLVMRHTKPHAPRPYRVPTIIPCIVLAVSVFLSVTPMIAFPTYRYLFIACFMLVGYVIYHYYVYEKKKSKFSRKLTYLVQMLFMVVAPDEDDSTSGSCATSSEDQTASAEKEKLAVEDEIAAR